MTNYNFKSGSGLYPLISLTLHNDIRDGSGISNRGFPVVVGLTMTCRDLEMQPPDAGKALTL